MKKILLIILLLVRIQSEPATAAQEIVLLQSFQVKPYEEAGKGFISVYQDRIKRLVISELEGVDIQKKIKQANPSLVLAIGMEALSLATSIKDIPVIYLMVLNPQTILAGEENVTGVSMYIPPEKHLMALLETLPGTETIGFLYDPERSGRFVEEAHQVAAKMQVQLVAREIHDPRQAPSLVMDMKDTIDVFWMLPDLTVIIPETVEFLLLFSFQNKIPLFTFSEKYVEMGAFLSVDIDAVDMGRQAGEMALEILAGQRVEKMKQAYARKATIVTNAMIARKLGIRSRIAMNLEEGRNGKISKRNEKESTYKIVDEKMFDADKFIDDTISIKPAEAPIKEINWPKSLELSKMTMRTAVMVTEESMDSKNILKESFRYTKAVIKDPITPVAADSEGVAIPSMISPITKKRTKENGRIRMIAMSRPMDGG